MSAPLIKFSLLLYAIVHTHRLTLVAVMAICLVVLVLPSTVLIVLGILVLIYIDLMGSIALWDLEVNSITTINLVMAVGLVVDYSAHIAHNFSVQSTYESSVAHYLPQRPTPI